MKTKRKNVLDPLKIKISNFQTFRNEYMKSITPDFINEISSYDDLNKNLNTYEFEIMCSYLNIKLSRKLDGFELRKDYKLKKSKNKYISFGVMMTHLTYSYLKVYLYIKETKILQTFTDNDIHFTESGRKNWYSFTLGIGDNIDLMYDIIEKVSKSNTKKNK